MFFRLFNMLFFIAFNIFVALCGTLLYKKALENESIYQRKIHLAMKIVDSYKNNNELKNTLLDQKDFVITNYDKLLHYWLKFVNSSITFLHKLNSEFLNSLLPRS
ncbi:MAG: hypothetical protein Q8889_00520 [Candidatus Phytoplasma australasiaticum]|nr:hypothetical protein [Candidatus Phytoplasma australasiaticum]MDV3199599.1 hypothetical protein [Candidatus Phytoplasma australasiaticum]